MSQKFIFNRKYLANQLKTLNVKDISHFEEKWEAIKKWNYSLQYSNLARTKEESIQGDFLSKIFTTVLDYKDRIGRNLWHIQQEQKTKMDGTKADGSLGFFTETIQDVRVVIELKDAQTDLDKKQKRENNQTPVEQAFSYQYKMKNCRWVIVSNFKEIRLYHSQTMTEYEEFLMEDLATDEEAFKKFYFLLNRDFLINRDGLAQVDELYVRNEAEEEKISETFYEDYKKVRKQLYSHLVENNPIIDEITLFEKTQKILDRFIFVCFCEDTKLLPENVFRQVIQAAKSSFDISETKIWNQLKGLFRSIDKGNPPMNINRFNGGLFKEDEILDTLIIKDDIFPLFERITEYDFHSELDVNLLGHIFEQSISDIEEFKSEIRGEEFDKNKSKRKKDGIFYTPTFVTQFIVENTIGEWIEEKRRKLGEKDLPELTEDDFIEYRKKKNSKRIKKITKVEVHIDFYTKLQQVIRDIKILDPACGSGAFLNAAFDYLFKIGTEINNHLSELEQGQVRLFDLDKHILKNNLYGVDLNKESVEITKLSLWLKTANKRDPLTSLDENIRWGNSLVSDEDITNNVPFNWKKEFAHIIAAGGFDIIVGNPPYVRVQNLESKIVDYFFKKYRTPIGKLDISILFFEKGLQLLKSDGNLCYISSSQWMQTDYGKKLRGILSEGYIQKIIDFGSLPVFGDADTYPAIFLIRKNKAEELLYKKINELSPTSIQETEFRTIEINSLNESAWNFNSFDLVKHLKKNKITFKDMEYYAKALYGCTTGMDKVFVVAEETINKYKLEKELLYPYAYRGEEIEQFGYVNPKTYIIYPYKETDEKSSIFIEEEELREKYVNIYNYLLNFKEELQQRKDSRKLYAKDKWYVLVRPSSMEYIKVEKILFKGIDTIAKAGLLEKDSIFNGANVPGIIPINNEVPLLYLLGILNSILITEHLNSICPKKLGGYYRYNTSNLNKIPIVKGNEEEIKELVYIVEQLITFTNENTKLIGKFHKRINENLGIKKVTKKLESFSLMTFIEFLQELKKQNVKLSLADQDEWEDYFYNYVSKIQEKNTTIEILKQRLNYIVNQIYNVQLSYTL
ncbi:Eco57I restriction-modification methylase domain-containing protein [Neobacillus sp. KR4-4]|uniref:Eco57I restriction-modification methylase domain-containing protein n=1 Tax=Neobacillus sp. KR4-4 TaxID=3344872 RepID=UPI0035CAE3AE